MKYEFTLGLQSDSSDEVYVYSPIAVADDGAANGSQMVTVSFDMLLPYYQELINNLPSGYTPADVVLGVTLM